MITKEMAKKIAENIDKDELMTLSTRDVLGVCDRFDIESVDMSSCEDWYEFERKVNEKFEEFVKESCVEEEATLNYFYSILEKLYPEYPDIDYLDWDELDLISKEIKFKDKDGKTYNFDNFGNLVFGLGEKGMKYLDEYEIYRVWDEYEEDQKSYGKDNGSGWSPNW